MHPHYQHHDFSEEIQDLMDDFGFTEEEAKETVLELKQQQIDHKPSTEAFDIKYCPHKCSPDSEKPTQPAHAVQLPD